MSNEEKKITFSFSKIKKTTLAEAPTSTVKSIFENKKPIKTSKNHYNNRRNSNSDSEESSDNEKDLVTEIVGKKVKSTKQREEKKPPIIELKNSKRSAEDLDAIRALIEGSSSKKSKTASVDLKIESKNPEDKKEEEEEEENIEDPDYEKIQLEDFGLACLRGMGWSEKGGIGKTNKQVVKVAELELRPKGLGLGAAFGKSKKKTDGNENNDDESNLNYVKGAYLQVINGKHENKYAQLVSFDDGLNRILIKIADTGETISILQALTRLVTKSEYNKHLSNK